MYNKVKNYVQNKKMLSGCRHVVIGLSGGADSVCLAVIMKKLSDEAGFTVSAVHVHHGIRGAEADRDRDYCVSVCKKFDIEYTEFYYDVPDYAKKHGITCEEAGRNLRYGAMQKEAARRECAKIAVAHHLNDQAETVIFNMCRGSGIRGMRGMLPERDGIIRPLLCCTRDEIEAYLESEKISYCTDSTNEQDDYARNRIRHTVVPFLTQNINPRSVQNIAAMAERMAETESYLEAETDKRYEADVCRMENAVLLKGLESESLYIAKRIIMKAVGEIACGLKDIGEIHVEAVAALINAESGKYADVRQGITARREQNGILIYREREKKELPHASVEIGGLYGGMLPFEVKWNETESFEFSEENWDSSKKILNSICTKCFDYDKIKVGLRLRTREDGDYLEIDAQGHRKKLNQYFIDEKIPEYMRSRTVLLADGHHVMWVVGKRISAGYRITEDTKRVLRVCCKGLTDGEN